MGGPGDQGGPNGKDDVPVVLTDPNVHFEEGQENESEEEDVNVEEKEESDEDKQGEDITGTGKEEEEEKHVEGQTVVHYEYKGHRNMTAILQPHHCDQRQICLALRNRGLCGGRGGL